MSLENKYVFLSNPKCASTQIEKTFANSVELPLLMGSKFGKQPTSGAPLKHTDYADFRKIFSKFFDNVVPRDRFFVFGIARDPVQRLRSYYNFMTRPNSPIKKLYEGITFENYLEIIANNNAKNYKSHFIPSNQANFFSNEKEIGVNFICKFESLENSYNVIKAETGLSFHKALDGSSNASSYYKTNPIPDDLMAMLKIQMADEYQLYNDYTDRLLVKPVNWTEEPIDPEHALKCKLPSLEE